MMPSVMDFSKTFKIQKGVIMFQDSPNTESHKNNINLLFYV